MARKTLSGVLCILLGLSAAACDVEEFFGVKKRKDPPRVGILGDAGGDGDGDDDGGAGDGDGDALTDGGLLDAGPVDLPECEATETDEDWSDIIEFGDEAGFSLARGLVGFGLAYRPLLVGCDRVHASEVPGKGAFPIPPAVLGQDRCDVIRDLSLVHADGLWHMAWTDNSTGQLELHAQSFGADLQAPEGDRLQLSDTDQLIEENPVTATLVGRPVVAWITSDGAGGGSITTQRIDGIHDPQTVLAMDAGHRPVKVALAQMGEAAGAVAWVDEQSERGVWTRKLDDQGAAVGDAVRLSRYAGAGATVDLATRDRGDEARLGGAAVYSVSQGGDAQEVFYRRLGRDGTPVGVERTIVGSPLRASDASVAELGGAYIVAYRALPGGEIERPEIRIIVVSREGDIPRDDFGRPVSTKLADATMTQARITLRISVDGQMLATWMDVDPDGNTVLRMSRKRLDCR